MYEATRTLRELESWMQARYEEAWSQREQARMEGDPVRVERWTVTAATYVRTLHRLDTIRASSRVGA